MSKGGSRRPTTGGEGQGGGFMADNNPYRKPYSDPYRQGGFRVPMGQSGDYSRAGQRSGSLGNKGGQQRPPYMPSPYERQPQYNQGPRFPSRGNAKGGIGGMAPPPSSRYNPQRPDYTAQPYRPTTPNFRQIGRDALANTSSGGFGSSPNPPPQENLMQPAVQPPMNPSKGGNYGPMPAPVQQPMPESRPRYDDVGGPALPSPAELSNLRPAVQPPMSPSKGGTQQQKGGYNFAGQYNPNLPSGYGTDYQTFGGPRPAMPQINGAPEVPSAYSPTGQPAAPERPSYIETSDDLRRRQNGFLQPTNPQPMPMDQPALGVDFSPINYAERDAPMPMAQPMPAMMPSKGGMPMTQFNPQPVPPIQSPSFTPSREIRSPLGPRNMRYGR